MYCNNCHKSLPAGQFCKVCGSRLTEAPVVVSTIAAVQPQPQSEPGKDLGITSMVLGILACVNTAFIVVGWLNALAFAIPALIFAICGLNRSKGSNYINSFAKAGMIMAIIVMCIIFGAVAAYIFFYIFMALLNILFIILYFISIFLTIIFVVPLAI